jgi:hypothetical protein
MDIVVIVLLVLLSIIVLVAKGKPLWSKLKTLLEQLEPLWSFLKEKHSMTLISGLGAIWLAIIVVTVIIEAESGIILVSLDGLTNLILGILLFSFVIAAIKRDW